MARKRVTTGELASKSNRINLSHRVGSRRPFQTDVRRNVEMANRHLQGETYRALAEEYGLDVSTVFQAIQRIAMTPGVEIKFVPKS